MCNALDQQYARRTPIGVIALREGVLSVKGLSEILSWQNDSDLRFGETAVQLGHLQREEFTRLINIQAAETPPIGEVLVDMGILDRETLEAALDEYDARHFPKTHPVVQRV